MGKQLSLRVLPYPLLGRLQRRLSAHRREKHRRLVDAEKSSGGAGRNRRVGADGHEIGFYVAKWQNPHPDKTIASIDFYAASRNDEGEVDYINLQSPVPALAAITGEF